MRSAHDMGLSTVAVYADGDQNAPFVADADEAIALRGETSTATYLDVDKVLAAAQRTGADAIHPGYGFLAENAGFARAVQGAGLVWIGPSPEAIESMGDKLSAKKRMVAANVPTLPSAEITSDVDASAVATEIGFPLLVKASAGGGGKGMRVVGQAAELEEAVASARREAAASFGDDTVFLERWLQTARHVEIQLLGDEHGNLVHCFERECSIQRRHQKIIEEAPSPAVSPELRERMGAAAVAAGAAIGYSSAGTVEFLLDGEDFWFLEVNTRLQVEHPVTEQITGLDLVREQIRVASGEPLGFEQSALRIDGHAIEARLYAEDPDNGFLPSTGTVVQFDPAADLARFDSGVESGSEVGINFDPMLAKVIVHAPTRKEAAARLARALEKTRVQGLVTNRDFLISVLRTPEFLNGDTTTDFLDRVEVAGQRVASTDQLSAAAIAATMSAQCQRRTHATTQSTLPTGWRNSIMPPETVSYQYREQRLRVLYQARRGGEFLAHVEHDLGEEPAEVGTEVLELLQTPVRVLKGSASGCTLVINGRQLEAQVTRAATTHYVHGPFGDVELHQLERFPVLFGEGVAGGLVAPMPGKVLAVHCGVGDTVETGQLLLVLEAMKMEHRVKAPTGGVVAEVRVIVDEQVENKQLLVVLEDSDGRAD